MSDRAGTPTTLSVMERALFPEAPPPTLGRFEVIRQLGRGGMGIVYLARDPALKREVAIKVHGRGLDDRARLRMQREAESLARLRHRNVVTVHEVGMVPAGDVFAVMEYLPGPTLERWAEQTSPSAATIVRVMLGCARGLAAAHDAGLVHGDFKPGNVVLDEDEPKIIDFGLARPGPDPDAGQTLESIPDAAQTGDGAIAGTPRYMAPELWRGEPRCPASDQFALCVALFELLAGHPPFAQPRRFEPAPRRPASIDRRIWAVLRRGLALDAAHRFASMHELADRLQAASSRIASRRKAGIAALAAAIVGAGALVFAAQPGSDRAAAAPSPATPSGPIPAACTIGDDLLSDARAWVGNDPAAIERRDGQLRLTTAGGPADTFVNAHLSGDALGWRDRSIEFEVVAAPGRGDAHELIVGLEDAEGVLMAGVLLMGGRWVFPLAPGIRELSLDIGPRDRFFRIQVRDQPGQAQVVAFEMSSDGRTWRPIARTIARVGPGRPTIALGSREAMAASGDTAVVRGLTCGSLHEVGPLPYERDLALPRLTEAERAAQDPAPGR